MESYFRPMKSGCRRLPAVLLGLLLLLLPVRSALAIDPVFHNTDNLLNYLPYIPATNFVNDGTFSFNGAVAGSWLVNLYKGWQYTQNFTNNSDGEMDCITGFNFLTYNPQNVNNTDTAAASFYNAGLISCGGGPIGGINVWATNISNGGVINVGADGYAQFVGNNLDFGDASVTLPSLSQANWATGQTGVNATNANFWNPSLYLGPTSAEGSGPLYFYLTNSAPYFDIRQTSPTNFTVRMIFLQDNSAGVATNVYFNNLLGDGFAHVEWVGTYTNPATGQPVTHYLYLDDDYVAGSSSNILSFGSSGLGVPWNYSLLTCFYPPDIGFIDVSFYNQTIRKNKK